MFCTNCGKKIQDDIKYCPYCGAPVLPPVSAKEEPVVEEPVAEEPVVEEPAVEEPVAEEPIGEEPVGRPRTNGRPASGPLLWAVIFLAI